jgi:hypothetical protein
MPKSTTTTEAVRDIIADLDTVNKKNRLECLGLVSELTDYGSDDRYVNLSERDVYMPLIWEALADGMKDAGHTDEVRARFCEGMRDVLISPYGCPNAEQMEQAIPVIREGFATIIKDANASDTLRLNALKWLNNTFEEGDNFCEISRSAMVVPAASDVLSAAKEEKGDIRLKLLQQASEILDDKNFLSEEVLDLQVPFDQTLEILNECEWSRNSSGMAELLEAFLESGWDYGADANRAKVEACAAGFQAPNELSITGSIKQKLERLAAE